MMTSASDPTLPQTIVAALEWPFNSFLTLFLFSWLAAVV